MRLLIIGSGSPVEAVNAAAKQLAVETQTETEWPGDVDLEAFVAVLLIAPRPASEVSVVAAICERNPRLSLVLVNSLEARAHEAAALPRGVDLALQYEHVALELGPRLLALVRRSFGHSQNSIQVGALRLDLEDRSVFLGGNRVQFHEREVSLLEILALRAGETVSVLQLLSYVYGPGTAIGRGSIKFHIHRVRKKLALLDRGSEYLQTVGKRGFMLKAPDCL
jgi:DNA-binding response OmpR family regulator